MKVLKTIIILGFLVTSTSVLCQMSNNKSYSLNIEFDIWQAKSLGTKDSLLLLKASYLKLSGEEKEYRKTLNRLSQSNRNQLDIKLKYAQSCFFSNYFEFCLFTLEKVKTLTPEIYRNTRGTNPENIKQILAKPDTSTIKGKMRPAGHRSLQRKSRKVPNDVIHCKVL